MELRRVLFRTDEMTINRTQKDKQKKKKRKKRVVEYSVFHVFMNGMLKNHFIFHKCNCKAEIPPIQNSESLQHPISDHGFQRKKP